MIKRSFIGLTKPRLQYNLVPGEVQELPVPSKVVLLLEDSGGRGNGLKVGDSEDRPTAFRITGQRGVCCLKCNGEHICNGTLRGGQRAGWHGHHN